MLAQTAKKGIPAFEKKTQQAKNSVRFFPLCVSNTLIAETDAHRECFVGLSLLDAWKPKNRTKFVSWSVFLRTGF